MGGAIFDPAEEDQSKTNDSKNVGSPSPTKPPLLFVDAIFWAGDVA
jgi:hypothetical protein